MKQLQASGGLRSFYSKSIPSVASIGAFFPHRSLKHFPCLHLKKLNSNTANAFRTNAAAKRANKAVESAVDDEVRDAETPENDEAEEDVEEYEEETWLEEKFGDAYEFTATVMQAVPGPRVGASDIPWLVAVPASYLGISFAWAIIRLILKYNSSKSKKKRQVGKNALLCQTLDEYLPARRLDLNQKALSDIRKKFKFPSDELMRKYIRYAINERPFSAELVADLVHLRKITNLSDENIAEVLNEISRRVVKAKGPIVMDTEGMTEKGLKRKAAVQGIFSKLFYLSQVEDFCSSEVHDQLQLKVIFGITDEDADLIKIDTLSSVGDVDSLEQMLQHSDGDGGESDFSDADN